MKLVKNKVIKFLLLLVVFGITFIPDDVFAAVTRCKYEFSFAAPDDKGIILNSYVTSIAGAATPFIVIGQKLFDKFPELLTSPVKMSEETYVLSTDDGSSSLTAIKRMQMEKTALKAAKTFKIANMDANGRGIKLNSDGSCPSVSFFLGQLLIPRQQNYVYKNVDSCKDNHLYPMDTACGDNLKGTKITEEEFEKLKASQSNYKGPQEYGDAFDLNNYNQEQDCSTIFGDVDENGNFVEGSLGELIQTLLNYIKILGPILVIVLSGLDFAKAVLSDDEEAVKKAQKKLYLRLIAAVAIFLVPQMIEIAFAIFNNNIANPTCGFK